MATQEDIQTMQKRIIYNPNGDNIQMIKDYLSQLPNVKYDEEKKMYFEFPDVNPKEFWFSSLYRKFMKKTKGGNIVNYPGRCGWTLLGCAAQQCEVKLAKWLIQMGANVDEGNDTMSCLSVMFYDEEETNNKSLSADDQKNMLNLLLNNGVNLNQKDESGYFPLEYALINFHMAHPEVIVKMIENTNAKILEDLKNEKNDLKLQKAYKQLPKDFQHLIDLQILRAAEQNA